MSEAEARELVDDSSYEVLTETPTTEHPPDAIPYANAASASR